jgi:hypothetical protein
VAGRRKHSRSIRVTSWLMSSPYGTQFLFGTLMFAVGKHRTLELLTRGLAPSHHEPAYKEALYYSVDPSTTSTSKGACSCLNPYIWLYYLAAMTSQGYPIGRSIFQPSTETSSSTSSGASTDRDSTEHYPEIRGQRLLEPNRLGPPYQHGGSRQISFPKQLQQVPNHQGV